MDWPQVLAIVGTNIVLIGVNIALFLWVRTETRADHRALLSWTQQMMNAMQQEMKDFHGRLCAIEEKNKK